MFQVYTASTFARALLLEIAVLFLVVAPCQDGASAPSVRNELLRRNTRAGVLKPMDSFTLDSLRNFPPKAVREPRLLGTGEHPHGHEVVDRLIRPATRGTSPAAMHRWDEPSSEGLRAYPQDHGLGTPSR